MLDDYRRETEDIKAALKGRIEDLCRVLLPQGRAEGKLWVSHNPRGDDHTKNPALKVRIRHGDLGAWSDWRNGDKGDVFGLIAHCKGCDFNGARAFAKDFLGLKAMSRDERAAMRVTLRQADAARQEEAERARMQRIASAGRLWDNAGTGGEAMRHALAYFAERNCALEDVAHAARETFRFSASTEYWKGAQWRHEPGRRIKVNGGPKLPAIHSAMRNRLGVLTACHVTFLDPMRPAKAALQPAKLMLGEALGAVIELAHGPEDRPFWQAVEAHPLIIAEGIETGLSLAGAIPEARVWAAGSLAGIAAAPADMDCVSRIIFARDNNFGNAQAQAGFERALTALEATGKRTDTMASLVGDDFNDWAQE